MPNATDIVNVESVFSDTAEKNSASSLTHNAGRKCTFKLDANMYCLEVIAVQEIINLLPITPIPLLPPYVKGLVNLRGQVVTAVELRALFQIAERQTDDPPPMCIVCQWDGLLFALIVDEIGDVIEVEEQNATIPVSIPLQIRRYLKALHRTPQILISELDLNAIMTKVNQVEAGNEDS